MPRAELDKRVALLAAGQCRLLDAAAEAAAGSDVPGSPRANAADDDAQRRAERAAALAHLAELSAASAALTAMPMAPASLETLAALRDGAAAANTSGAAAAGLPLQPPARPLGSQLAEVPAQRAQWTQGGRSWTVRMYSGTPACACG